MYKFLTACRRTRVALDYIELYLSGWGLPTYMVFLQRRKSMFRERVSQEMNW